MVPEVSGFRLTRNMILGHGLDSPNSGSTSQNRNECNSSGRIAPVRIA
jgi:hypothetical protein